MGLVDEPLPAGVRICLPALHSWPQIDWTGAALIEIGFTFGNWRNTARSAKRTFHWEANDRWALRRDRVEGMRELGKRKSEDESRPSPPTRLMPIASKHSPRCFAKTIRVHRSDAEGIRSHWVRTLIIMPGAKKHEACLNSVNLENFVMTLGRRAEIKAKIVAGVINGPMSIRHAEHVGVASGMSVHLPCHWATSRAVRSLKELHSHAYAHCPQSTTHSLSVLSPPFRQACSPLKRCPPPYLRRFTSNEIDLRLRDLTAKMWNQEKC